MAHLYTILRWIEENGEVKAIDRLRIALLPELILEAIQLAAVTPSTVCSPALLERVIDQAAIIVGRPCPASPIGEVVP